MLPRYRHYVKILQDMGTLFAYSLNIICTCFFFLRFGIRFVSISHSASQRSIYERLGLADNRARAPWRSGLPTWNHIMFCVQTRNINNIIVHFKDCIPFNVSSIISLVPSDISRRSVVFPTVCIGPPGVFLWTLTIQSPNSYGKNSYSVDDYSRSNVIWNWSLSYDCSCFKLWRIAAAEEYEFVPVEDRKIVWHSLRSS